ncbi:serine hydrolase domain-containing protein [Paludibacter sp.]
MKTILTSLQLSLLLAIILFTSCEKNPNEELISQMKAVTDSVVQNAQVTGVVALVVDHKKGINWIYTSGYNDVTNKLPINTSHIFRIGSNTKTMTGTVLLQLVDEGILSLDDKLSKFYPELPRADEVTIAMLCNMTSGIYNYTDDEDWGNEIDENPTKTWSPHELVEIGFSHPYIFDPGTDWKYSNTNTIILGMIIEKLTGNSLQKEMENRLFKPLNLTQTALITKGTELPEPCTKGYVWDEENVIFTDATSYGDVSWAWAAGSVYSTPRELQKYVETLVGGGYLSDNLQRKRLTELHSLSTMSSYGYAILRRGSFFGHNGGLPGYTSSMYHSKEKDCSIIIYFNCYTEYQPDNLFLRFVNILYGKDF